MMREQDLLPLFSFFMSEYVIDFIPYDNAENEGDDDLTDLEFERLIACFINDQSAAAIDDQVVRELVEINQILNRASSDISCNFNWLDADFDDDMVCELWDTFTPLIFDRFGRLMLA
jgi:hypothetical protein